MKKTTLVKSLSFFIMLFCAVNFGFGQCGTETATWNGTDWNWTGGVAQNTVPTIATTSNVIINGDYDTSAGGSQISFSACSLTVTNLGLLNIADNTFVEVQNNITVDAGGSFIVQPYGTVVQIDDSGIVTNNGSMSVTKKTAPLAVALEYTYWSSPVFGETIGNGLFEANVSRRYKFIAQNFLDETAETGNNNAIVTGQDDIDDNGNDWQWVNGATVMQPGVGYASTHDPNVFVFPGVGYDYTFDGRFNTGIIYVPVYRNDGSTADNNWNFIGNPYPSAISASAFLTQNNYNASTNTAGTLAGAIYYWSQNTPPSGSSNGNQALNFATSDYAIENGTGGSAGGDGILPNGFIPSGQGFFVSFSQARPSSTGSVVFNNSMRVKGSTDNSLFFKNSNTKVKTSSIANKIWVNLTSDNGVFNQILVGYVNGATNNDDDMFYDAPKNLSSGTTAHLYTTIVGSNKKFAIQGKDVNSINENEIIKLGFKTSITVATLYTLSIDQLEGDFLNSNAIYLKDNLLNKVHCLSTSDYTFTSAKGEFNNRFEIAFSNQALAIEDVLLNKNSLKIVELENDYVQFNTSNNLSIKTVQIFDLLGRALYQFKGETTSETYRLSNLNNSVFIAKVTLSNGGVITKKVFKK
ncbi:T9SS type A sorting domain-containing protein [Mariniflexile soesokkakense]|uniref:T9SS type A sorting domain-containing protein n=1 Tax=Mariniflexile soesokkakense TaxID=1343160 RepID=A0ABV0AC44_9FLAO